jgi:hypothetical protein
VAFSDPQSVTIGGATTSLARVSSGDNTGTLSSDDQNVKLTASHSYGKRTRRTIRIDHRKVAADPLQADQNLNYSMACYIVVDVPTVGYTPAEAKEVMDGLLANLAASSSANQVKFLGGQS